MAIIPPKQPKIMAKKKYFIYRYLLISQLGGRYSTKVKIRTDNLEEARKKLRSEIERYLPIKRIFLSYHEF